MTPPPGATTAVGRPSQRGVVDTRGDRTARAAVTLSLVAAGLALVAAVAGLTVAGVYGDDAATAEMLRGYDLVTVVAVTGGLVATRRLATRDVAHARLLLAGLDAYLAYTFAYHLFGTGFTDLFLLHAAVFAGALWSLVLVLASLDVASVARGFGARTRVRAIAAVLALLAVALGGMWIYVGLVNVATGEVPAGSRLVETDAVVHLGMALDLTVLVPPYAAAAVLLWRRAPWGYVLAAVALLAGVLHQLSYLVAMPFQVAGDVPGAVSFDPAEPVIALLYLLAAVLLVRGRDRPGPTRGSAT